MASLVLEGGSLRAVFTCGVLDALLDHDLHFDYVIGVSAGIAYGISYVSGQRGRNIDILRRYRSDPRYFSKRNLLRYGSLFDWDFLFDEIPNRLHLLDRTAILRYEGKVYGVVTRADNGRAEYRDAKQMDKPLSLLRASSAIPYYTPRVTLDGAQYFDGGLSDSIPIRKSIEDGNRRHLIVLTQPPGFVKEESRGSKLAAKMLRGRFPHLSDTMLRRPGMYNETLAYISELEECAAEDTVVLRPSYALKSFESRLPVIEANYQHGYALTVSNLERIRTICDTVSSGEQKT